MTPQQISLVRRTWKSIEPHAEAATANFYARLFELDPALRAFFGGDLRAQRRKLAVTISMAVASLDRLEKLVPTLRELGRRHASYGVENRHYATVGTALLDTLADGLGDAFTPAAKEAWTATYTALANAMKSGAAEARPLALAS